MDEIKLLYLEDNPMEARLVMGFLSKLSHPPVKVDWQDRLAKTMDKLARDTYDVILTDLMVPDSAGGLDTFRRLHRASPSIPIVILTGTYVEEATAVEAVGLGAQDYLTKGDLNAQTLWRSLRYAIERHRVEMALKESHDSMERRVEERTRDLAGVNRELETLLTILSHDLTEPLRTCITFSERIIERDGCRLDAKGAEDLRRIKRAAARMKDLLDGVAALSSARRMPGPSVRAGLNDVVSDALARISADVSALNARVRVDPGLPTVLVNRTLATEAIYNLLTNALKFTRPNERPDIEIGAYSGIEGPGIVVKDRGPGIDPSQLAKIFIMCHRAVGREVPGTGVGLAIVQEVARQHKGRAWAANRDGGGSEFFLTFESSLGRGPARLLPPPALSPGAA